MIVIAFVLVAIAGIGLTLHVWKGELAPWWMSVGHALIGAVAILLLVVTDAANREDLPNMIIPLCILLAAVMSGVYLASLHARKLVASHGVVGAHIGVALAGVGALIAVLATA